MPYEKNEIDLSCDKIECINNEDGDCICDEDVQDLDPNDSARCFMYSTCFIDGAQFSFSTMNKLEDFVHEHKDIAPIVPYDPQALELMYVSLKCPAKNPAHDHCALVQITKEDAKQVLFKPSVEGSILVLPIAQTEMIEIAFDSRIS